MIKKGDWVYGYYWGRATMNATGTMGGVAIQLTGELAHRYIVSCDEVLCVAREGKIVASRCARCRCLFACDLTVKGWLCDHCRDLLAHVGATVPKDTA